MPYKRYEGLNSRTDLSLQAPWPPASLPSGVRPLFFLLFLFAGCAKPPPDPSAGNQAFFSGDYTSALSSYHEAFGPMPQDAAVCGRMAISHYLVGRDYPAFIELYNHYLRISGKLDRFRPSKASLQILESEKFGALQPSNAETLFLAQRDIPHLMRMRLLSQVARRVTREEKTEKDKVQSLVDWVIRNIRPTPDEVDGDAPADPWGILMRGYGVCDRGAWVLVSLAQQVKLHAHIVYLRNPDDPNLASPHTLATVQVDGQWILCDTYAGFILRDGEGKFLTLEDILDRDDVLQPALAESPEYPLHPRLFEKAMIYLTFFPGAILPRMSLLQQLFREELGDSADIPLVFQDLRDEVFRVVGQKGVPPAGPSEETVTFSFPHKFPGRDYQAEVWPYPFRLVKDSRPGFEFYRGLPDAQAKNKNFRDARFHQLFGDFPKAILAFESASAEEPGLAEHGLFFAACSKLEAQQAAEAIAGLEAYIEKFPQGTWRDQARLLLALSYQGQGNKVQAKTCFEKVEGPRRLGAWMALLQMKEAIPAPEKPE